MSNLTRQIRTHLQEEFSPVFYGLEPLLDILTINVIAGGSLLVSGPPGTGKTLLSKSLLQVLGQTAARIDCGNDIEFTNILHTLSHPGAKQTTDSKHALLYLSGVNRLTPNTQAILLPMMEEQQLINNGKIINLSPDFRVIATYAPDCFDDTYPILAALLDRFYVSLPLHYLNPKQERDILKAYDYPLSGQNKDLVTKITPLSLDKITQARQAGSTVTVTDAVYDYVINLVQRFRHHQDIQTGVSHRAALSIINAAKIHALLNERDYVNPDDIQAVAQYCLAHRLQLNSDALINGRQVIDIISTVLQQVELPPDATNQD